VAKKLDTEALVAALRIAPGAKVQLREEHAERTFGWEREAAELALKDNRERLGKLQYKQYSDGRHAVLMVLQALDGGGKDGTVRHVVTAMNPQGCRVVSFKAPSPEELKHDYLWRIHAHAPRRGEVAVFNRSHYEDVLVVRVNELVPKAQWSARYAQINDFERLLSDNGTHIVKFFLHISRDEQRKRFEERIAEPRKQWKFNPEDLAAREKWDAYRKAYEDALSRCSTANAPWYRIPADRKWFRNFAVSAVLRQMFESLPLRYPKPSFDPKKIRIP
jgi:PPK2 family polyphosphate:nucleotide phosphotransferase